MAVSQHYPLDEFQRLKSEAAEGRVRAIRSQIALSLTFCSIAESQLKLGYTDQTRKVLEKLQRFAATIRRHLDEPDHVPSNHIETVRTELDVLESKILALEERKQRNR